MRQFFQRILAWFRQLFQRKPTPIQRIGHGMHRIKRILGRRVQPMTRAEKRLIERRTGVKIK